MRKEEIIEKFERLQAELCAIYDRIGYLLEIESVCALRKEKVAEEGVAEEQVEATH